MSLGDANLGSTRKLILPARPVHNIQTTISMSSMNKSGTFLSKPFRFFFLYLWGTFSEVLWYKVQEKGHEDENRGDKMEREREEA